MNINTAINVVIGGAGTVTPHPDDKSKAAEDVRATLAPVARAPETPKEPE